MRDYPLIMRGYLWLGALLLVIMLLFGGCGFTPQGDLVRSAVAQRGADAYDEGLANAEWFMCTAASIGSIRRNYCRTQDDCTRYLDFCQGVVQMRGLAVEAE